MAESNGSGRLDRIEAALAELAVRQDRFQAGLEQIAEEHDADFKKLMTWQVLTQEKMDRWDHQLQAEREERIAKDAALDGRVDRLVAAIGEFIRRVDGRS
jgi:hypothetical protein